ncbi:MAG TPA: VWA domain-containing protein [Thermoanaerobaculia bacterium]
MSPLRPHQPGIHLCVRIAAVLMLLLCGAAGIAEPPPSSPPMSAGASSEISVTVVEIPVEVMRGNEPVEGLQAADFEVLENGHPLPIVSCETIELRASQGAEPARGDQSAPAPAFPPQAARRHVFLFFDFALSRPDRQIEGIAAARRMVAGSLDSSDLVGVGIYLPKGELPLLLPFTTDRAAVDRTLAALSGAMTGKAPVLAAGEDGPLRVLGADARKLLAQRNRTREVNFAAQMIAEHGDSVVEALGDAARVEAGNVEARQRGHVMAMAEALAGLADYLRPIEGRKYLALFSEGFSGEMVHRPTEGITDANLGSSALLAKLNEILGSLRRLGWVIHAANLGTLRGGGLNGDGLFILANQTGGVLVEGGNDLAPGLGRAMSRSAYSYLLTVQVDVPPDGSYHPLEVRLRKSARGTKLRHRGGYFAPRPVRRPP